MYYIHTICSAAGSAAAVWAASVCQSRLHVAALPQLAVKLVETVLHTLQAKAGNLARSGSQGKGLNLAKACATHCGRPELFKVLSSSIVCKRSAETRMIRVNAAATGLMNLLLCLLGNVTYHIRVHGGNRGRGPSQLNASAGQSS